MIDVGPTDAFPGNFSDQQLFVLALLAIKADTDADDETARDTVLGVPVSMPVDRTPGRYRYSRLSWIVAEEFDKVGLWIRERGWGLNGDISPRITPPLSLGQSIGWKSVATSNDGVRRPR